MCGIVSYFGSAGNGLTRILSGMSAIIYRAPDSLGIGVFGDDRGPIRTLKSVGALPALVEAMTEKEIRPNRSSAWLSLLMPADSSGSLAPMQRRLLHYEGFAPETFEPYILGDAKCASIDELVSAGQAASRPGASIRPGRPGCAQPAPSRLLRNRQDLASLLKIFIEEYDLSPVICKILISNALRKNGEAAASRGELSASVAAILDRFDEIFEEVYWRGILGQRETQGPTGLVTLSALVEGELWRILSHTPIGTPPELDRDGVRWLLRDLESSAMCRILEDPGANEQIEDLFKKMWPAAPEPWKFSWKDIFEAEKTANVYGWAAGAVLEYMRAKEVRPRFESGSAFSPLSPGETDPRTLHCLATPIIAHGRWALQSAVTVDNAHPFTDSRERRAVVLNGQFNGMTEANLLKFLHNSGTNPRSANSTEYLPLVWEGYYEDFVQEKNRSEVIRRQMDAGLESLFIGSQTIDYRISRRVQDKSGADLDEMALVEAVRQSVSRGGQAAVTAVSVKSPRRLYVAACHRPVFIVQRKDTGDVMVVSDIQAALGLFPQSLIHKTIRGLLRLEEEEQKTRGALPAAEGQPREPSEPEAGKSRRDILDALAVRIVPLEGESLLARIEAEVKEDAVQRSIRITDFSGAPVPDIETMDVVLNPLQSRRHLFKSFFEAHLEEIPQRLRDALRAYLPDPTGVPLLDLNRRHLRRRFGARYERLKRVVLVGMGSSYHTALMSRLFFETVAPWLQCQVLRPVEIEDIDRRIDADRDLVVLLSALGTSADMVEFAHEVTRHHGTLVGITEKPFSEMALIAHRTGGVIPVLSGEEVTFSSLKSCVCTGFICRLLAVWLAFGSGRGKETAAACEDLVALPSHFESVLANDAARIFARKLAQDSSTSYAAVVFDALHSSGAGLEIAAKLEESSWSAAGKALDYADPALPALDKDFQSSLIIVNATQAGRLNEALDVMKLLYVCNIPFAAVSFAHSRLEEVRFYSRNRCIDLPRALDANQPLLDLAFYYPLALQFGLAHGRRDPGFPRNRAKSVTAAAQRPARVPSRGRELSALEVYEHTPLQAGIAELEAPSLWEAAAPVPVEHPETMKGAGWVKRGATQHELFMTGSGLEVGHYRGMRRLARVLSDNDPLGGLVGKGSVYLTPILEAFYDSLSGGAELVFAALDDSCLATAQSIASVWRRMSKGGMEVLRPGAPLETWSEDSFLVFLSASPSGSPDALPPLLSKQARGLWMGFKLHGRIDPPVDSSLEILELDQLWEETLRPEVLYATLNLLLIEALRTKKSEDCARVEQAFSLAPRVIASVLNDGSLREEIARMALENPRYRTLAFVGPSNGVGERWINLLDNLGACPAAAYIYGESAHGPVVTVDPSAENKYVPLDSRSDLVETFGAERVEEWEKRYLAGSSIDEALASPQLISQMVGVKPFFAAGKGFLPIVKPDYDPAGDNLILIDATSERDLPRAMDELSLFGCRFARVVLVCQQALSSLPAMAELYHYPISQILFLPPLSIGGAPLPIPEILLPFAMSLTAMEVGAHGLNHCADAERLRSRERIFEDSFGAIGKTLIETQVTLSDLNHRTIESLQDLAPVVESVSGVAVYRACRMESAGELNELLRHDRVYGAEEMLRRPAKLEKIDFPLYMVYPERHMFVGEAKNMAGEIFSEQYWDQWFEVYGDTWRSLSQRRIELNEGPGARPRIELPLIESGKKVGRLLHYYLAYKEWNATAEFDEQIEDTIRAMGKYRVADDPAVTLYTKLVSHFNNAVIPEGYLWNDAFVTLAPRSSLFAKPANAVAQGIAGRVIRLAALLTEAGIPFTMERIVPALRAAWPRIVGALRDGTQTGQEFEAAVLSHFTRPGSQDASQGSGEEAT